MDPALLKEHDAFRKRALALPTVEKRKQKDDSSNKSNKKSKLAPKPKGSSAMIKLTCLS